VLETSQAATVDVAQQIVAEAESLTVGAEAR